MHELHVRTKMKYTFRSLVGPKPTKVAHSEELRKELQFRKYTRKTDLFLSRIVAGIPKDHERLIEIVKNRFVYFAEKYVIAHKLQLDERGYRSFFDLLNMLISFEFEGYENKTVIGYEFDYTSKVVRIKLLNGNCVIELPFMTYNQGDAYIARYRELVGRFMFIITNSSPEEVKKQVAIMLGNIPHIYGTNLKDNVSIYKAFSMFIEWYNELNKYRRLPNDKPNEIKMQKRKESRGEYLLITSPHGVQFVFQPLKDRFICTPG